MLDTLGHYKILDRIGEGGLGVLYRARDTRLGRTVAIRVVHADISGDPERLARFLESARASAAVSHPNIAALYEVGEAGGSHYLACEFVPGQPLRRLIAGSALNPRRAIDLTVQVADALADAQASDGVHGDIRPDTIIVTTKGNAKLLDFGLASWTAGGRARAGNADHQADIRALGAVLFEMLTGRPPSGSRAPSEVDPHLPRELDPIVLKALDAADSYQASATLAAELRSVAAILDVRNEVAKESAIATPRSSRRREVTAWIVVLALLTALAWVVWTATGVR
jgi:eukaryotic-like serine/threonine-protein kinase